MWKLLSLALLSSGPGAVRSARDEFAAGRWDWEEVPAGSVVGWRVWANESAHSEGPSRFWKVPKLLFTTLSGENLDVGLDGSPCVAHSVHALEGSVDLDVFSSSTSSGQITLLVRPESSTKAWYLGVTCSVPICVSKVEVMNSCNNSQPYHTVPRFELQTLVEGTWVTVSEKEMGPCDSVGTTGGWDLTKGMVKAYKRPSAIGVRVWANESAHAWDPFVSLNWNVPKLVFTKWSGEDLFVGAQGDGSLCSAHSSQPGYFDLDVFSSSAPGGGISLRRETFADAWYLGFTCSKHITLSKVELMKSCFRKSNYHTVSRFELQYLKLDGTWVTTHELQMEDCDPEGTRMFTVYEDLMCDVPMVPDIPEPVLAR